MLKGDVSNIFKIVIEIKVLRTIGSFYAVNGCGVIGFCVRGEYTNIATRNYKRYERCFEATRN